MKKLLVLVGILALVAAMVVPMAALADSPVVVNGYVPSTPSLLFTAPSGGINFGPFALDRNPGSGWVYTPTPGSVILNPGILTDASWTLTASSAGFGDSSGRMYSYDSSPNRYLTDPMYITFNGTDFVQLPTVLSMTGTASQSGIYLQAAQTIEKLDAIAGIGDYTITINLACTPNF